MKRLPTTQPSVSDTPTSGAQELEPRPEPVSVLVLGEFTLREAGHLFEEWMAAFFHELRAGRVLRSRIMIEGQEVKAQAEIAWSRDECDYDVLYPPGLTAQSWRFGSGPRERLTTDPIEPPKPPPRPDMPLGDQAREARARKKVYR